MAPDVFPPCSLSYLHATHRIYNLDNADVPLSDQRLPLPLRIRLLANPSLDSNPSSPLPPLPPVWHLPIPRYRHSAFRQRRPWTRSSRASCREEDGEQGQGQHLRVYPVRADPFRVERGSWGREGGDEGRDGDEGQDGGRGAGELRRGRRETSLWLPSIYPLLFLVPPRILPSG